jgi:hypothetical protein
MRARWATAIAVMFMAVIVLGDIESLERESRSRRPIVAMPEDIPTFEDEQHLYTDEWILHVPAGEEKAREIAADSGFRFLGKVRSRCSLRLIMKSLFTCRVLFRLARCEITFT